MSRLRCHIAVCFAAAVALQLLTAVSSAQDVSSPGHSNASPADVARISPLLAKSRVAVFRELLGMSDRERDERLATYSPVKRDGLKAKIKEYESLTPEQCELRLLVTELQEYLLPLMTLPSTNRAAQISLLPTNLAPMVEVRLQHWDSLSPTQQNAVLENKSLLQHLTDFASINPMRQNQAATNMTPAQRQALQEALTKWQGLSRERRLEITRHFKEFFDLTPTEKQKTLSTVSDAERAQIEKAVRQYYELNPRSKARVRAGLDKFCQLSPAEFGQFLRNAERWKALSPTERKAWRDLVSSAAIQPPLPPGARPVRSMPPNPADAATRERVATNR